MPGTAAIAEIKSLIKSYETAKSRLDASEEAYQRAMASVSRAKIGLEAAIVSRGLSRYTAVYIGERDAKSGAMKVKRLVAGKNLDLGPLLRTIAEADSGEGAQSPECDAACDQASQDFADDPNYPGEGAWTCDCTMTDAGPVTVINGVVDD
jgi:hypothetical protein